MKKLVITLVCLVLVIVVGGGAVVWFTYDAVDEGSVPAVQVEVAGQAVQPAAWEWHQPVLGGLLYKHFAADGAEAAQLGDYEAGGFAVTLPQGYDTTVTLRWDDAVVFEGPPAEWQDALTTEPGAYSLQVLCHRAEAKGQAYGSFLFEAHLAVLPPPEPPPQPPTFTPGNAALEQGDIFVMRLDHIPEGVQPTAATELGMANFLPAGEGAWFAMVPVGNHRQPGVYPVDVTAGEDSWQATVTVSTYAYPEQNLIIDTSSEQITEANSAAAYQQYREKIPPLFATADDTRYWEGPFIRPAEGGWISTEFGAIRYTNGDYSSSRSHYGMDIAVAEGTPVVAPNNGRVVLAEYLLNTGNTIVIEHGGGLKSYYFHLSALNVEPDTLVEKGQLIGAVGSTGYSTGAHLHYEMRIGDQAVSPSMLFEDSAGLYSVEGLGSDVAGDAAA